MRVSSADQAISGLSIDAQRARVEAWAEGAGLELVSVLVDAGVSADSLDREGLAQALAILRAGEARTLVVAKLDRLTRSVSDLGRLLAEHFDERGADLVSVAETIDTRSAAGRLVLHVLGSVAQWEREAISERTAAALRVKRARGERAGAVPYGYRLTHDGARIELDEREQHAIREAVRLSIKGLSLRAVAAELARAGIVARSGRAFDPKQIARIIDAATEGAAR